MKASLMAASLALLATMAGCIGNGETPTNDPALGCVSTFDPEGIQIVETDHDPLAGMTPDNAFDFETTNKRTCSLPAVGWSALSPDGVPHKYIGEIDMRGDLDLGAVAVLGNSESPRVYLVDISDRAAPQVVSYIDQDHTYIVDVKISDDGKYLFTASQSLPRTPTATNALDYAAEQPAWASEGPQGSTGFTVYDISDPAKPSWILTHADPQVGCHMLSHEFVGDKELLFCVSQQVRVYELERGATGISVIGTVDHFPPGEGGLPHPSDLPVRDPTRQLPPLPLSSGPHDMTVTKDDKDGRTYATVSHWNEGVRILDVTDFPQIKEVGAWEGEGATHYDGNIHTAMMFYVGDQRYIMASPEYTYEGVVPSMWILDANDLSDLKLVAEWFHPGEHESQGLFLTTHQWQVAPTGVDANVSDVQVYLTYNHGGVWVLDFEKMLENDRQGAILGFNLARTELDADATLRNAMLATWDVNLVDGYMYGSDRATGLWVFHHQDDPAGDARYTGFA